MASSDVALQPSPNILPQASRAQSPWPAVFALTAVSIFNIIDRNLPAVLAELIKRDLSLSDTALGLINGFGFLVVYALAAIPVARLADRKGHGIVIAGCVALWSSMTLLGGLAQSGWQLALSRTGVAMGEAGATPASHAYIANHFPPAKRARPLAVLSLSAPISVMTASIAGGLLGQAVGWRATFMILGTISLLFAPVAFFVLGRGQIRDDAKGPAPEAQNLKATMAYLLRKRSFQWILLGGMFVGMGSYALQGFSAAFLMRVHELNVAEVGVRYGLMSIVGGALTLLLIGTILDPLSKRDPRWILWLLSLIIVGLIPFAVAAFLVEGANTAIVFTALTSCVGIAYLVPVVTAIQRVAPPQMRGTASAIGLFAVSMLGGLGPLFVGMISDRLTPSMGDLALGRAMLVVPVAFLLAAASFAAAARSFVADIIDEDPQGE